MQIFHIAVKRELPFFGPIIKDERKAGKRTADFAA